MNVVVPAKKKDVPKLLRGSEDEAASFAEENLMQLSMPAFQKRLAFLVASDASMTSGVLGGEVGPDDVVLEAACIRALSALLKPAPAADPVVPA